MSTSLTIRSNADADAFMRKYLTQPTDVTARLVFADWLEETGQPHNIAWAYYIRLKAEADRYEFNSHEYSELERQAAQYAPRIRANLTIPAKLFVGYPKSLLALLPLTNITLQIGTFLPAPAIIDRIAEETARAMPLLPLDDSSGALLVAHPTPVDERAIRTVHRLLAGPVIVVGGDWEGIIEALNVAYAAAHERAVVFEELAAGLPSETDAVPDTYPVHDGAEFLDDVLRGADRRQAVLIIFIPHTEIVRVCYRRHGGVVEAGRISLSDWRYLVYPEILRRGEATGTEFTVEVIRHGSEQAVRIWRF